MTIDQKKSQCLMKREEEEKEEEDDQACLCFNARRISYKGNYLYLSFRIIMMRNLIADCNL